MEHDAIDDVPQELLDRLAAEGFEQGDDHPLEFLAKAYTGKLTRPVRTGTEGDGSAITVDLPISWELRIDAALAVLRCLNGPPLEELEVVHG